MQAQTSSITVDHLVYAVPDLAAAVDRIASEWGVHPAIGGKHPSGTHNALLALGPHTYLEIIAPDPEQADARGRSFGLDDPPAQPRLVTWAVATDDLDQTVEQARARGQGSGEGAALLVEVVAPAAGRSVAEQPLGLGAGDPGRVRPGQRADLDPVAVVLCHRRGEVAPADVVR